MKATTIELFNEDHKALLKIAKQQGVSLKRYLGWVVRDWRKQGNKLSIKDII